MSQPYGHRPLQPSGHRRVRGPAVVRLALVVGVLAGLFGMHGAAPGHADLSTVHPAGAGFHLWRPGVPVVDLAGSTPARYGSFRPLVGPSPTASPQASQSFNFTAGAQRDHMVDECALALVAGLALLLVGVPIRLRRCRPPGWPPAPHPTVPVASPRPTPRPPDLFDLCVLRL